VTLKRYRIVSIFDLGLTLALVAPHSSAKGGQDSAPQDAPGQICSLSDKQQADAPKAFAKMVPTFKHARCINCHGGVDPFTGDKHGGDTVKREADGKGNNFPFGGCDLCHSLEGWKTPETKLSFVGKDAVQLCKQMKREHPDASEFIAHITEDRGRTPFVQVSFLGTRALDEYGQEVYEKNTHKKFKPEPPPISQTAFVSQGETWIEAMGGKFTGDDECGCVPHHYTLSVTMKAVQDSRYRDSEYYLEMNGTTKVPMKFQDDGSFEVEAQLPVTQTGFNHAENLQCTINGIIAMNFKVKGKMDDAKPVLHLHLSNGVTGGSITTDCNHGVNGTRAYPSVANPPGTDWDMPSFVGVDQEVPTPYQNQPSFTSSMKIRIMQTD
jgi:hypothetical protein